MMNIIIGRAIFIILCSVSLIGARVDLKLSSMDGRPLEQVGAGHPFMIEVTAHDLGNHMQQPTIAGTEQMHVRTSGFHIRTINGASDVVYKYRARIDQPGTYTIGPAEFGSDARSNTVTITACEEQKIQQESKKNSSKKASVFMRLTGDKQSAVVGEKIQCTLRFYASDKQIQLQQIIEPSDADASGFSICKKEGPLYGKELVNGAEHAYAQWRFELYPTKPGTCVIPAFGADFLEPERAQDFWGMFGMAMISNAQKRIYSNALSIPVNALPAYKGTVHAVGHFTDFTARMHPAVSSISEGVLLTFEITGEGDFDRLALPELTGMPQDNIKWYDSKHSVTPLDGQPGVQKKTFEYIVQGLHAGSWTIPVQEFTFYDSKAHVYKTLKTQPITLTVMNRASLGNAPDIPSGTQDAGAHDEEAAHAEELRPLRADYGVSSGRYPVIPWSWFFMIVGMMLSVFCCMIGFSIISRRKRARKITGRALYKQVKKQLQSASKQERYTALYTLFIDLFADRYGVEKGSITQEFIDEMLVKSGAPEHMVREWNQFFAECAECVYFDTQLIKNKYHDIFNRAVVWVETLQTIMH